MIRGIKNKYSVLNDKSWLLVYSNKVNAKISWNISIKIEILPWKELISCLSSNDLDAIIVLENVKAIHNKILTYKLTFKFIKK